MVPGPGAGVLVDVVLDHAIPAHLAVHWKLEAELGGRGCGCEGRVQDRGEGQGQDRAQGRGQWRGGLGAGSGIQADFPPGSARQTSRSRMVNARLAVFELQGIGAEDLAPPSR